MNLAAGSASTYHKSAHIIRIKPQQLVYHNVSDRHTAIAIRIRFG